MNPSPRLITILAALLPAAAVFTTGCWSGSQQAPLDAGGRPMPTSIHDFTVRDIEGNDVSLGQFRGKALLLVNVASKCGFTPQYEGLQKLYETYRERGLVILGFPANDFLWQEPGTDAEIKTFCSTRYGVSFPMFAKISVKGKDQHPLYRFLTDKRANPSFGGRITWNFNKFLIGRDGTVRARFGSRTKPDAPELIAAVEVALKEPVTQGGAGS